MEIEQAGDGLPKSVKLVLVLRLEDVKEMIGDFEETLITPNTDEFAFDGLSNQMRLLLGWLFVAERALEALLRDDTRLQEQGEKR